MDSKELVKKIAIEAVEAEKEKNVSNETKKRTAVANVNAFIFENPDIKITDKEIDELVEELVKNGSK